MTYVDAHTVGFDELARAGRGLHAGAGGRDLRRRRPARSGRRRATARQRASGCCRRCLQGVYQSHQATAAAVPGQQPPPPARHARQAGLRGAADERPADRAEHPRVRRRRRPARLPQLGERRATSRELAELWNVDPMQIPHYGAAHPRDADLPLRRGGLDPVPVDLGTNPAVSLPELGRIRRDPRPGGAVRRRAGPVPDRDRRSSPTSCCPAATWGEKTGTFTNADRTVHLSDKAVDPPGEARRDLDIFLDYARRMDFRDKDGAPLVKWRTPRTAFEAWKECSAGRPCDYTGLSYDGCAAAAGSSGRATRSAPTAPSGSTPTGSSAPTRTTARPTARTCVTGRRSTPREYRALQPGGRAMLKAAEYLPPHEAPDDEYPLQLTTGPHRLPLPHPHEDRPGPAAAGRRPRRVGRDVARGRRRARRRRGRPGGGRVAARRGRGAARGSAASARASCSCRSTTATGTRRRRRAGRHDRAANELTMTTGTRSPSSRSTRRPPAASRRWDEDRVAAGPAARARDRSRGRAAGTRGAPRGRSRRLPPVPHVRAPVRARTRPRFSQSRHATARRSTRRAPASGAACSKVRAGPRPPRSDASRSPACSCSC